MAWVVPLLSVVAQVGSQVYSASAQSQAQKSTKHEAAKNRAWASQEAEKQRAEAEQKYKEYAYRNAETLKKQEQSEQAKLESAKEAGYENILQKVGPSSGWGAGSGLLARAGAGLEKNYLSELAQLGAKMSELKTTPMWGYPNTGNYNPGSYLTSGGSSEQSPWASVATGASNAFSTAAGYINTLYGNSKKSEKLENSGEDDWSGWTNQSYYGY